MADEYKDYLGDGVYVDFDGFGLILTTENSISVSNHIYLEPEVLRALFEYTERPRAAPNVGTDVPKGG